MRKNRCRLIKLLTKIQWIHFIVYSLDISMIFNQIEFWKILWHHDKIWSHMQLRIMANSSHIYVIIYSTFHIFNIANIPFGEDIEQNQTLQKKLYDVINKILEPYTNWNHVKSFSIRHNLFSNNTSYSANIVFSEDSEENQNSVKCYDVIT